MSDNLLVKLVIAYKKDLFEDGIKLASDKLTNDGWKIEVEKLNTEQREVFLSYANVSLEKQKYVREAPFVAVVIPLEKIDIKKMN